MGQVCNCFCKALSILYSNITSKVVTYGKQQIVKVFTRFKDETFENARPETGMDPDMPRDMRSDASNALLQNSCHEELKSLNSVPIYDTGDLPPSIECPLSSKTILSYKCTSEGGIITSDDGLKITVPKNAIMEENLTVTFYVAVDLFGPFVLYVHLDASLDDLVSPYYWIGVGGLYHFQKPVLVEFEHYGACDPSHYQLLSCEDDDESHIMKPNDNQFDLIERGHKSFCRFQTYHFCSNCLVHSSKLKGDECKGKKIAALCLIPCAPPDNNDEPYKAQVWITISCAVCLNTAEKFYGKEGLKWVRSLRFEASCDERSKYNFKLKYDKTVDGWQICHEEDDEFSAAELNFYSEEKEDLEAREKFGLFPPRFIICVKMNANGDCTTSLNTTIHITLCYNEKVIKSNNFDIFRKLQPKKIISPIIVESSSSDIIITPCQSHCIERRPTLKELMHYQTYIAGYWKPIAVLLNIPSGMIKIIHEDKKESNPCYLEMCNLWLEREPNSCWCKVIESLIELGHINTAKMVNKHFTKLVTPNDRKAKHHNLTQALNINISENNLCDVTRHLFQDRTDVINNIIHNGLSKADKIKKICDSFVEEGNLSWTDVYRALKEAECYDAAAYVKASLL